MVFVVKGFLIGASMLIPGVSGGTIAMLLGIYDKLIFSVSSFHRHKKESLFLLAQTAAGGLFAVFLLSGPMTALNQSFPREMAFFVIGAILGGIPVICRAAGSEAFSFRYLFWPLSGFLLAFLTSAAPSGFYDGGTAGFLPAALQFFAGILGALALILPGISFSSMLYLMGVYDLVFGSLAAGRFLSLLPFGMGGIFGVLAFTRLLERSMKQYPKQTYLTILGFVLASVWDIYAALPSVPAGGHLVVCLLFSLSGLLLVRLLSHL